MAKNWIQKASIKKGALHRALGVPSGEPISEDRLKAKSGDSLLMRKRKSLAKTLKGFK